MQTEKRPWYKKKRYLIPLAIILTLIFAGIGNANKSTTSTTTSGHLQVPDSGTTIPTPGVNNLSNNNYYVNVNGNTVHSPAYSNSVPVGATAVCRDGTYSFSQNHSGTCSHHGGVSRWL